MRSIADHQRSQDEAEDGDGNDSGSDEILRVERFKRLPYRRLPAGGGESGCKAGTVGVLPSRVRAAIASMTPLDASERNPLGRRRL